jgi:hypothetical protein
MCSRCIIRPKYRCCRDISSIRFAGSSILSPRAPCYQIPDSSPSAATSNAALGTDSCVSINSNAASSASCTTYMSCFEETPSSLSLPVSTGSCLQQSLACYLGVLLLQQEPRAESLVRDSTRRNVAKKQLHRGFHSSSHCRRDKKFEKRSHTHPCSP